MTRTILLLLCISFALHGVEKDLPAEGLIVDLNADAGLDVQGEAVLSWRNQAEFTAKDFKAGRDKGRPTLRKNVAELNGHASVVFKEQEVLNEDENAFDSLTQGRGYTWAIIFCAHKQTGKLKDVNVFIGNLRNAMMYEGFWAGLDDDNTLWMGSRNGKSFGRWNADNPKVKGFRLEENKFYVIAGRMSAGTDIATLELFVNSPKPVASAQIPVNDKANPSKLAIGTERDAVEHPGVESFDGEMARVLIWQRPLSDTELAQTLEALSKTYGVK